MTDNLKPCPCEELKRALNGENYEIISELVDAHFAQAAEIEILKADQDGLVTELAERREEVDRLNAEIERMQNVMARLFIMSESLYDSGIKQKIRELLWVESKIYYERAALEREAANE